MPLTSAERKRRSRAMNPEACETEKEKSRERMSIYRGKNRAQKRARDFKALLTDAEAEELATEAKTHKISLLRDWLKSRDLGFSPDVMIQRNITNLFVSKIEMHKIERGVAEFEIAYIQEMLSRQSAMADVAAGDSAAAGSVAASKQAGLVGKTEPSPQEGKYQVPALPPLPAPKLPAAATAPELPPVPAPVAVPALPPVPAPVTAPALQPVPAATTVPALPSVSAAATAAALPPVPSAVISNDAISGRQAPHHDQSLGGNADRRPRKVSVLSGDVIGRATDGGKGQQPHEDAINALLFAAGKMD